MTKKDLIEIGKFLTNFFKHRKDTVGVFITEGTENMSKKECAELLSDMFGKNKHYTYIFDKSKR